MRGTGVYLTFTGDCAKAFEHYEKVFTRKISFSMTNGSSPMKDKIPEEHHDKIMHVSLDIGIGEKFTLMGCDANPIMHPKPIVMGTNTSITLMPDSIEETKRLFDALSKDGTVTMPLANQFWGSYFGTLTDAFGVQWMFDFAMSSSGCNADEKKEDEEADNKHQGEEAKDDEPEAEEYRATIHPVAKETIAAKTCVGLLHRGPYDEIGSTFKKFFRQMKGKNDTNSDCCHGHCTMGGKFLGLYLDNPQKTKPEDLRSYAALELTADNAAEEWPEGWKKIEVGGGPAAVMTVNGCYSQLGDAWKSFGDRVLEYGWKCSGKPEHISQEVYVGMDTKDASKNVTKLVVFLEE